MDSISNPWPTLLAFGLKRRQREIEKLVSMSLDIFIEAHIINLRAGLANPYFKDLMVALEASYRTAIQAMPPEGIPTIFGRFLLICDKAMRSAAMLIAARQPEDSVAITRRAIEAAKTALA